MKTGPRAKPTAIKKMTGVRKSRISENEPEPGIMVKLPKPPLYLTDEAKEQWHRVGNQLIENRIISEQDLTALEIYVDMYSRYVEASRLVQQEGMIIWDAKGKPTMAPWLRAQMTLADSMRKWLSELGLTPSARTGVEQIKRTEHKGQVAGKNILTVAKG